MESAKLLPATSFNLASTGITSTYALIGKMLFPARIITFTNSTPGTLIFSFDGINDHQYVISMGSFTLDAGAARGTPETSAVPPLSVYVRAATAPASGNATFSYWYAG